VARSADETSHPARIAKICVDDFARIGPKATPIRAQESSREGRLKISGGGFPSQKANAGGRWKRSGVEVAKAGGRLACLLQKELANLQINETGFLMAIEPPTIASLQSQGVPGFFVTCSNPMCLHSTPIAFETLSLDPSTPLPEIEKGRSFICPACGSRQISTLPHWSGRPATEADR
jgi:hypothetical protein